VNDASFDWKALLLYIRERLVVPVIGPEAVTVSEAGRTVTFDRFVAERLTSALTIDPSTLPASFTLSDVTSVFLRHQRGDRRRLWIEILSIVEDAPLQPPETLLALAAIEELSLFVTTTFDPLLAKALAQVRPGAMRDTNVCAYSLRSQVTDLDEAWTAAKPPLVYHLFGRVSASGDYVVSDEDRLEFIHALQSESRQPRLLFDYLRDSHLLLIGCSFPDWLTRFFLRTLRRERLGTDRDRYEAVADDRTRSDGALVMFLNDCHVQVFPGGGTAAFVAELSSRLASQSHEEERPAAPPAPETAYSVFLSYASEDRERVAHIRDALEAGGIRVWFDQRSLEPGDEYKEVIRAAIEKCTFFFPCLSANSLTPQLRRFFRFEWNRAIEEADFRDKDFPFIQPLLIDEMPPDSEKIPPAFRNRHVQRCIDGRPPPEFVRLTTERLAAAGQAVRRA
jgi:TIR domain/SIR2-like domain